MVYANTPCLEYCLNSSIAKATESRLLTAKTIQDALNAADVQSVVNVVNMYKITIDKEKCIGCGACAAACENFRMDEDKAEPKQPEVKDLGCNQQAADVCPVQAIIIKEG